MQGLCKPVVKPTGKSTREGKSTSNTNGEDEAGRLSDNWQAV